MKVKRVKAEKVEKREEFMLLRTDHPYMQRAKVDVMPRISEGQLVG